MRKYIFLLIAVFQCNCVFAQSKTTDTVKYSYVQQIPEPKFDMAKYLSTHLKYPENARQNGKEGRVFLRFVVNEDGAISNIEVIKPLYPSLDSEAVRVVGEMPAWKPARSDGRAVKYYFTMPIEFKLSESKQVPIKQ